MLLEKLRALVEKWTYELSLLEFHAHSASLSTDARATVARDAADLKRRISGLSTLLAEAESPTVESKLSGDAVEKIAKQFEVQDDYSHILAERPTPPVELTAQQHEELNDEAKRVIAAIKAEELPATSTVIAPPVEDAVTERDAMSMSPQPIAEWEDGKPWPDEHARWWLCRKCHRAYASPTTGKPPAHCICFNESGILVTEAPSLPSDVVTRAKLEMLDEVEAEWNRWRESLRVGAFSHSDGLKFTRQLAALRAHLKGSRDAD
jgi:hypothetical protein